MPKQRVNFYTDLRADYSKPQLVDDTLADELIADALRYIDLKDASLPEIGSDFTLKQIEQENKDWWPTHCEALRQGRGDILTGEYRDELVYFCQDSPYYGVNEQKERERHWWALIAQPEVIMTWPVVMFHGEFIWFEWTCIDTVTGETTAKGSVAWVRRGHSGACYWKGEQLTFYRDVFTNESLLKLITTS
jgi:hypothetical protein